MKKIILSLMTFYCISFVFGQDDQTITKYLGDEKFNGQNVNISSRSVPPGTLIYSQPYTVPWYILRSETNALNIEVADDFILGINADIKIARWWFMMGNPPASTGWLLRIYKDQNCIPGDLMGTWIIQPSVVSYEFIYNLWLPLYDIRANLDPVFTANAGEHYWISIQAIGNYDFWMTLGTPNEYNNCMGSFRIPSLYPNWTPVNQLLNNIEGTDFTFEFYGEERNPNMIPVSNWAVGLGIFLIFIALLFRHRRLV